MSTITNARPKSMKIDLARKVVTISFEAPLGDDNQESADGMVPYRNPDMPAGTLTFVSQQPGLFDKSKDK